MEPQKRVSPAWRRASLDEAEKEATTAVPPSLGLLNGALLGLALAAGVWGAQAIALLPLPLTLKYHSLLLASALLVLICTLVGGLTVWVNRTAVTLLLWPATALLLALIIIIQPYHLRTLAVWLADGRFWGLPIYPFVFIGPFSWLLPLVALTAGLFILLFFSVLALLQEVRLWGIDQERGPNGRLTPLAWLRLLLPLPIAILVGYVTNTITPDNTWRAVPVVHRTIQIARSYEGDLFALGLAEGINYAAAGGIVDQLAGDYHLVLGELDAPSLMSIIAAEFTSGAWINCRLLDGQLNYCYDAAPPYTLGLAGLLTGAAELPACNNCFPHLTPGAQVWLIEHRREFGPNPLIGRQAQYGPYVLMSLTATDHSRQANCLFDNPHQPRLLWCEEQ
jgi:hypothetical protein